MRPETEQDQAAQSADQPAATLPRSEAASTPLAATKACLSYSLDGITLAGQLVYETFPAGDGVPEETLPVLRVNEAICTNEDKSEPDFGPAETDVRELQLVFLGADDPENSYQPLLNKPVTATGELFHSNTIHHRTMVLLALEGTGALKADARSNR